MPRVALPNGASVHCIVDDYLWPWDRPTPVLMMHGFARNALFWDRWVPAIAETRRVYRPDLLGCGLSDQPPAGYSYTPETIGAQIMAVLDSLDLAKVHWVGESSGGIIGLLLAVAHPERFASLTLCNTPTRIPDHIKQTYALDKATASDAMRAYGVGEWCRQTLGNRLDKTHASQELCDWVVAEMDRTPREVAAAMHDCFEHVDTVPLLPQIKPPVLLLSGDKSPIASAQQQIFAEKLPNGRVEAIAGVGHGVNLLQPERCARVAAEFWHGMDKANSSPSMNSAHSRSTPAG